MTAVSPAEPARDGRRSVARAVAVALAIALSPGLAGAQDSGAAPEAGAAPSGPVQLFPAEPGAAPDAESAPSAGDDPAASRQAPSPTRAPDEPASSVIGSGAEAVEVVPLGAPAADAVGLIDRETGGLPVEMWAGTSRSLAYAGLEALPAHYRSPTARSLAITLLTTAAPGPEAQSQRPPAGDFVAARIRALMRLGALQGALALVKAADGVPVTPVLTRVRSDARLAAGEVPAACADANRLSQQSDDPHWQKLLVFCQAAAGETGEARFGLDLLAEMGVEDPLFVRLADAMVAGTAPELSDTDPAAYAPLHAAMARTLEAAPPDGVAVEGGAAALDALLAAKPQALDLAEAAAWRGVLDPARLAELYAGADFTPADLDNPLSAAERLEGARARALLYQSLAIQTIPPARAELLTAALKTAARDGLYPLAVAVFSDQLMDLEASGSLAFFAETASRALYAAGAFERAGAWHALIRARAVGNRSASGESGGGMAAARDRLWMLGRLAGTIGLEEGALTRIAAFEKSVTERAPERAPDLMLRAYLPLAALEPDSDALRTAIARRALAGRLAEATAANPAAGAVMRLAAADGRVAETVLFALMRLGDLAVGEMDPAALAEIVEALAAVGLEGRGRQLALEAAIAAGL